MKNYLLLFTTLSINFVVCRDFYVGMFKKNDILVAQDRLYKERVPYRIQYAKYGRHFKCPITYFRVVDRLGYGGGPKVVITRGGLQRKYIVLRIQSLYNQPISVNIYVGCENRMRTTPRALITRQSNTENTTKTEGGEHTANDTAPAPGPANDTAPAPGPSDGKDPAPGPGPDKENDTAPTPGPDNAPAPGPADENAPAPAPPATDPAPGPAE